MIILDQDFKSITVVLGGAVTTNELDIVASYVDVNKTGFGLSGVLNQTLTTDGTTAVPAVLAPADGVSRQLKHLSIANVDTADATVTVGLLQSSTTRELITITLSAGDTLEFLDGRGWRIVDVPTTTEEIQDIVGAMVSGNTETLITVTYQDADGTIDFVVDNDLSNYDNTTSLFMPESVYDPANIAEQLVGLTATQSISGKTYVDPILNGSITGTGLNPLFASPPALGGTTPAAVSGTTGSFTSLLTVSGGTQQRVSLKKTNAPTDQKETRLLTADDAFYIDFANDALSSVRDVFRATRSSQAVTGIALGNSTDDPDVSMYGDLILATAGKGVDFSANSGSIFSLFRRGSSITLTPFGSGTAGSPTGTFTAQEWEFNDLVIVEYLLTFTSLDTMAGNLKVDGLTKTAASSNVSLAMPISNYANATFAGVPYFARVVFSDTVFEFSRQTGGGAASLTIGELANNSVLRGGFAYRRA